MNKSIKTSKRSNVYNRDNKVGYTTPSGSHHTHLLVFYKHIIPLGLETEIQNNLKGLNYGE